MSIAITEDHSALAQTASDFLAEHEARGARPGAARSPSPNRCPRFWGDLARLGWLGLHMPEEHGGSGFGLAELVVVVEELGRAVAPGPFVPTVIASAVIAAAGSSELQDRYLPGLVDGTTARRRRAAVASVSVEGGAASGSAGVVLGGGLADLLVVAAGDDVVVVEVAGGRGEVDGPRQPRSDRGERRG